MFFKYFFTENKILQLWLNFYCLGPRNNYPYEVRSFISLYDSHAYFPIFSYMCIYPQILFWEILHKWYSYWTFFLYLQFDFSFNIMFLTFVHIGNVFILIVMFYRIVWIYLLLRDSLGYSYLFIFVIFFHSSNLFAENILASVCMRMCARASLGLTPSSGVAGR